MIRRWHIAGGYEGARHALFVRPRYPDASDDRYLVPHTDTEVVELDVARELATLLVIHGPGSRVTDDVVCPEEWFEARLVRQVEYPSCERTTVLTDRGVARLGELLMEVFRDQD